MLKMKKMSLRLLLVTFLSLFFFVATSTEAEVITASTKRTNKGSQVNKKATVSFVNFSNKTVPLYWYSGYDLDGGFVDVGAMPPYGTRDLDTFVGHTFGYRVNSNDDNDAQDGEEGEKLTTYTIEDSTYHNVHIIEQQQPKTAKTIPVLCKTTQGDIHINVKPKWSPLGAARFLELVHIKYFDGCALNRVVKNFLTQFGISADYEMRTDYRNKAIKDDKQLDPRIQFQPGYMSYAGSGPNSRTSEVFIVMPNTRQTQLNAFGSENPWETPFGYVNPTDVEEVVGKWYSAYGDMSPWGDGPDPQKIYIKNGYDLYLKHEYPNLDYINECHIVGDGDDLEGFDLEDEEEEEEEL